MVTKLDKSSLIKKFQKTPEKYWNVKLFKEKNLIRKRCQKCGKFFWTENEEQKTCGSPPCTDYSFIGNSPTKKKLDYISSWKYIKNFFEKNGHTAIKSYPTVCRWFPGLYFTIASITAFQRKTGSKTVFELPENPLIIPQFCLRFNDIENVGISGRHLTGFAMIGQHSLFGNGEGYWKDRCIEIDYELLTKVFGINPKEITWVEDAWVGPNAFGYSLEYFVRGLEIGNAVFTEFLGTPEKYTIMDKKIIDMGAGLERFAWLTQGTPTIYDATFGPVIKLLKNKIDFDHRFFLKFSKIAGSLNIDESNIKKMRRIVSKKLNVSEKELKKKIEPIQAIYAITDHIRTLLFAFTDGGFPSNTAGGYNLRVLTRRIFDLKEEAKLDIDFTKIAEAHAKFLKPLYPKLKDNIDVFEKVLNNEKIKYKKTKKKSAEYVKQILNTKKVIALDEMTRLYESRGITPELIRTIAEKRNLIVDVPDDFYNNISSKHLIEKKDHKKKITITDVKETKPLFYKDIKTFNAKILKIKNSWVILDQTAFYPESGGQKSDKGFIEDKEVLDVQKLDNIILHKLSDVKNLKIGQTVKCKINWKRRKQLMQHHTAAHIINLSARRVLGKHVNQTGANKTEKRAHLDITHFEPIEKNKLKKIEQLANNIVNQSFPVKIEYMKRQNAEKKYGTVIYQGGAVPEENLRIVSISDDHEACCGTHCKNTGDVKKIILTSSERIQDAVIRINFVAGKRAVEYQKYQRELIKKIEKIMAVKRKKLVKEIKSLLKKWKNLRKKIDKKNLHEARKYAKKLAEKNEKIIIKKVDVNPQKLSLELSKDDTIIILFRETKKKIDIFGSAGKKTGVNIGKIVKNISKKLGGMGGGSPFVATGYGIKRDEVENIIKNLRKKFKTMD